MATMKRQAAAWALDPRATLGVLLAGVLLLALNVAAYLLAGQIKKSATAAAGPEALLADLSQVVYHLLDAETARRGYVLTGQPAYLESYQAARQNLGPTLAALRQNSPDDSAWKSRLDRLEELIAQKEQELETTIDLRGQVGMDAALRSVRATEGNGIMDEIRRLVDECMDEAKQSLQRQAAQTATTARYLHTGIAAGNVLTLALLAGAVLLLNRTARKHATVEAELRRSQEELEMRVQQRTILLARVNETMQEQIAEHRRALERAFRLVALVESSEDAIVGLDRDGRITSWNPGAERLLGYRAEEACGLHFKLFHPPDKVKEGDALGQRVRNGESVAPFETTRLRKDGSEVHLSISVAPVRDGNGQVIGAAAVARDISQRRALELQLRQAAKMEAVGRLAAGVAHDFNNLLTVILGSSDLLLVTMRPDAAERSVIEEIAKAGDRAAALTRQLLAFSRQQPLAPSLVDLNEVVAGMGRMLPRLLGSDVHLDIVLLPEPAIAFADPGQLEQVLLNLAVNARDAMPRGGKLTIQTQGVELDEAYTQPHKGLQPGPYVLLAVSDTGYGMSEEVRAHLFEPFFTTKEKGKGTGLGLAMVYSIVKQSGGHISVQSQLGGGTTFKVFLPRRQQPVVPVGSPSTPLAPVPGGNETVLLVEDDAPVRSLMARVLRQRGYRVLEAADGKEALRAAAAYHDPINLLVIDVVMPGVSGQEVAERLVQDRASLRVLFLSGHTEHAVVRDDVMGTGMAFLPKPFTPDALARKVRAVLEKDHGV